MKKHFLAIAFAIASILSFTPAFNAVNAAPVSNVSKVTALQPLAVTGTNAFGSFAGTFTLQKFVSKSGQILAVGTLTGTFTDLLGNVTQIINQLIQIPVSSISGSCQILHLEIGPI